MSGCDTVLAVNDDGLPSICGWEPLIENALLESAAKPQYLPESRTDFGRLRSAAAIALHMHQPLIPAGGRELHTAEIISNLKYMLDHRDIGDNHNAPVFLGCYQRMGEFIGLPLISVPKVPVGFLGNSSDRVDFSLVPQDVAVRRFASAIVRPSGEGQEHQEHERLALDVAGTTVTAARSERL